MATHGLIAQVLVSKYGDHAPLYRQPQIFARHGVEPGRSTLANWVGGACWWLEPLHTRLAANVFAADKLFADDTPIAVLDPGRGGPRQAGCGSIRGTIGRGPVRTRRRPSTSTALIARPSDLRLTSAALAASCRSMAMPGSTEATEAPGDNANGRAVREMAMTVPPSSGAYPPKRGWLSGRRAAIRTSALVRSAHRPGPNPTRIAADPATSTSRLINTYR
jgi:hypothetical protein